MKMIAAPTSWMPPSSEDDDVECCSCPVHDDDDDEMQRPQRRRRRTVTFSSSPSSSSSACCDATVADVLSRHDYTEEEASAVWYAASDYKKFKRTSMVTLQLNRAGQLPSAETAEQHTMRGLECRTREGMAERKAIKAAAKAAVMEEQARQRRQQQDCSAEVLAKVYQQVAAPVQYQACVQGMCDELEARGLPHLAQAVRSSFLSTSQKKNGGNGNSNSTAPMKLDGIFDDSSIKVTHGPAA